jgi:hypothetical protein
MAEKQPPRKVQAPRVRQHERRPPTQEAADRKRRMIIYGVAGSGLVALAIVLFVVFGGGGGSEKQVASAMEGAGCTYATQPAQEAKHVAETAKPKWNTNPPSSGPHYGVPAPFNFYDEPVDLLRLVHNLEHGGVLILYGDEIPDATVEELRRWWTDNPDGVIVSPLPSLGDEITLGAWTGDGGAHGTAHLARCKAFDADAFSTFRDELRANGPEPFPLDALTPGN